TEPLPTPHPDHRHPVRGIEEGLIKNPTERMVCLRLTHPVDTGDADITLGFLRQSVSNRGHRQFEVERTYTNAQNICARRACWSYVLRQSRHQACIVRVAFS